MIITWVDSGLANQFYQYAAGRRLAIKWNTELKLDKSFFNIHERFVKFVLDQFNIQATIATPEEIAPLKKTCLKTGLGNGFEKKPSVQEFLDYPDNIFIRGYWSNEEYWADIADILRKEFTLKNPLSSKAEAYKKKILSAECSVSLHFRFGEFLYNPNLKKKYSDRSPVPFECYQKCIDTLKQKYENITAFVFSDNLQYLKENLHLNVPTEFVEVSRDKDGNEDFYVGSTKDVEEFYLMSICKHNILPGSGFSWWAAWLNSNPDKRVFKLVASTAERVRNYRYSLEQPNKNSRLDSAKWIRVPFDPADSPKIKLRPFFSLLLIVNEDVETIFNTLNSIIKQDYEYYEIIVIDNASTDGSSEMCQQAIKGRENITYKKLDSKVNNAVAWNIAFNMAQGYYVFFLKNKDLYINNIFTTVTHQLCVEVPDFVSLFAWLEENENGDVTFGDKKYSEQRDPQFKEEKREWLYRTNGQDAAKLLLNNKINSFLGAKIYNRKFLKDNELKFDEQLADDEAELSFQKEAFAKSNLFAYTSNAFYIAPPRKQ